MLWEIERVQPDAWFYDGNCNSRITYDEMGKSVVVLEKVIGCGGKILVALVADNSSSCIASYLAVLRCGHAVMLLNAAGDSGLREQLLKEYRPEIVILPSGMVPPEGYTHDASKGGFNFVIIKHSQGESIHPDTAVLLSTSGTTGNPKFVRLSYHNIQSNAESIADYLDITSTETAVTSLPLSYSYGLSIVNSHLFAGGNLVCTDASVMTREFWQLFRECRCSSFAGVPYSYLMLERLRFDRMELPSLRTMTQAGGKLEIERLRYFADAVGRFGCRFFVMYGQTEATARISYLPWERLPEKIGSVGIPIPGGRIRVAGEGVPELETFTEGEVVYEGPNVMMGYADSRSDLAKGDELGGVLATGDIGYLDSDGYLFITGRLKRFIKIFGLRLNLDDVERMLEKVLSIPVACVGRDDQLHLLLESSHDNVLQESRKRITSLYHIHQSAIRVHRTSLIPLTTAGKKDYPVIERELNLHDRA